MTAFLVLIALLSLWGIACTGLEWRLDRRPSHLPPPSSRASAERSPAP